MRAGRQRARQHWERSRGTGTTGEPE
jgi:hypothetical protein